MRRVLFALLLALVFHPPAHAQSFHRCSALLERIESKSVSSVVEDFQSLPERARLGDQAKYEHLIDRDGGGACAAVCTINLVQVLRGLIGQADIGAADPIIRRAYADLAFLRSGRVTDSQVQTLLEYLAKGLGIERLQIEKVRAEVSEGEIPWRDWSANGVDPLILDRDEVKMIVYSVQSGSKILGRHFVVLKENGPNNTIHVVDPNRPLKTYSYKFKTIKEHGKPGYALRLESAVPRPEMKLTVDAVFTVRAF